MDMVEPYKYRDRLTLPKYILNSTGDEFFLPDSWQFYWDDLVGEKHLRYVPNSNHSMRDTDVIDSLDSWYHSVVYNVPLPRYSWRVSDTGTITLFSLDEPTKVLLWQATNESERNFTQAKIGRAYSSSEIRATAPGVYEIQMGIYLEQMERRVPFKGANDRNVDRVIAADRDGQGFARQCRAHGLFDIGVALFGVRMHDICITHIHDAHRARQVGGVIFVVIGAGMAKGKQGRGLAHGPRSEARARPPLGARIKRGPNNGHIGLQRRPIGLVGTFAERGNAHKR